MVRPKTRKSNHWAAPYRPLNSFPTAPPTTTPTTATRNPQRTTSTKVKRERERSFGNQVRRAPTSLILLHRAFRSAHAKGAAAPFPSDLRCDRPRRSGPNLLWVLADLESLGIAIRELVDGGLELRALAVLIAADRPAYAFELDRQHSIAQRLSANIGRAA